MKVKEKLASAVLLALAAGIIGAIALEPAGATRLAAAEETTAAVQAAAETAAPTEETKPVYVISENGAAPAPDESLYGETDDPEVLADVLARAEELLGGQTTFFTPGRELFAGSTVCYYLDETILALTWKEKVGGTAFTYSEIKVAHPSQFRRYLTGGEFGSGTLALTSEMAKTVNAVVACSGDFYAYRRWGLIISDGVANKYIAGLTDTCFVTEDGNLLLERDLEFEDLEAVQAYADENNIQFSLSFGPILVKDGEYCCPTFYGVGECREKYARAAICQMGQLHYLFAAANQDVNCYNAMTMKEFAQVIAGTGCVQAYALDGGQTATVVMDGTVRNKVSYGSERMISDIIYFATAKPGEGQK